MPKTDLVPVLCVTCDPPGIVFVPVAWTIDKDNYVCTACMARALKRIERAEMKAGRRVHGGSYVKE